MRGISRVALNIAVVGLAGVTAAACGSTTTSRPRATAPVVHRPAASAGKPIGATQRIQTQGMTLAVTVRRVIDPLRGSGAALPPGSRAIGVMVAVGNRGPGTYDGSSTGDVSVVASSGAVSPAYAPRGPCQTPDQDFDNHIGTGERHQGCVVFAVKTAARVLAVRFSANGGGAGRATWQG